MDGVAVFEKHADEYDRWFDENAQIYQAEVSALRRLVPKGQDNIERMLKAVIGKGGQVKACGTCSEARGVKGLALLEGVEIRTMSQLVQWAVEADKVLTF